MSSIREQGPAGGGGLLGGDQEAHTLTEGQLWVHIALHYLKPYRPSFQHLALAEELGDERVQVSMTHQYEHDVSFFSRLELSSSWTLSFYRVLGGPCRCLLLSLARRDAGEDSGRSEACTLAPPSNTEGPQGCPFGL